MKPGKLLNEDEYCKKCKKFSLEKRVSMFINGERFFHAKGTSFGKADVYHCPLCGAIYEAVEDKVGGQRKRK